MRRTSLFALAALLLLPLGTVACGNDSCKTADDCPDGNICRLGLCIRDPGIDTLVGGDADALVDVTLDCDPATATDLVLNEILADPPAGADVNGDGNASTTEDEFVEIVNVSSRSVALTNVEIDVGGKTVVAGSFCLAPNAARVVFHTDGLPSLTNGGATVSLKVDGLVVQSHTYGSEGGGDQSLTLAVQLDRTSSWVKHTEIAATPYSPGTCANGNAFPDCDGGTVVEGDTDVTDGETVAACSTVPTAGDLVINEIMADPGAVNDANQDGVFDGSQDEFIEIFNVSASTLLLTGVTVSEGGGKVFTFPAGTCIEPGQAAVMFGTYVSGGDFGGALPFGYGGTFGLNNTSDSVFLRDANGDIIDSVNYGADAGDDQSITRAVDGDIASAFVKHTDAARSNGTRMSPGRCQSGAPFPNCGTGPVEGDQDVIEDVTDTTDTGPSCGPGATTGDLAINEVGANAGGVDWNQDGTPDNTDDEFVEIVSLASGAVQLAGVQLKDKAGGTFTFPSLCLEAGYAVLVFNGGGSLFSVSALPAGNATPQTGAPGLNNTAESLTLLDAGGATLDSFPESDATAGETWVRDPEKTGGFVKHTAASTSGGTASSPGLCANGKAFPSCQ
ncbi:MAG: lamin tail domain-containing protein [Deltaproteobacteria bacterium]|nr:MAG: lamin tail domain-containing protein [Deltaproteobacteria bacterium]